MVAFLRRGLGRELGRCLHDWIPDCFPALIPCRHGEVLQAFPRRLRGNLRSVDKKLLHLNLLKTRKRMHSLKRPVFENKR